MTRIISLSDEAYEKLSKVKGNDSFTKTILRLLEHKHKKSLLSHAGAWRDDDEMDGIFKKVIAARTELSKRKVERW